MCLLMIPFGAFAQQGMVTGQVVDEKGESVIGATVQIKGTSDGTITDFDGNFSLKAKVGNTLVVSYVGYSTQEVKISKQTGNRIVLKEDAEVLDEVVVVGYGTARKGDLTGALTTMKPDANDAAKATSLDNLCQVRLPDWLLALLQQWQVQLLLLQFVEQVLCVVITSRCMLSIMYHKHLPVSLPLQVLTVTSRSIMIP